MKSYADLKNVSLLIISTPTYDTETLSIDPDILDEYWKNIANISDYYNFSGTTDIGNDPRYFYDSIHFRNIAGEMLLAFIFKDDEYYYPKNLGYFVNKNNVSDINRKLLNLTEHDHIEKVRLPIIMYHHISDHDNANEVIISKDDFKNHMIAIKQAGFTAISTQELISFANEGKDLPDKPILITFDDGYKSNYDLAYPILKELGIKSSINVIVSCIGLDKLDNSEIIPHFSIEEANEMIQSGLIDIQNHSYNLHSNESSNLYRKGIMPMPKESIKQYIDTLKQDNNLAKGIESKLINKFEVFSYPYGFANLTADTLLKELGYKMTLLTGNKINYVYKNDPISIFGLYRLNINGKISAKQLIELIEENG
jgi:peptidoglycan/xylan/chitin deacetylase (PgdA/CDA1 family)